jgi:hemoglobin
MTAESEPAEVITEASLTRFVDHFYSKVRRDPVLAEVFEAAIAADEWPEHLATIQRFWSSVMLTSGRYSGDPVAVHRAVRGLEQPMFPRWLELFEQSARELFTPATAAVLAGKAQRIAESLQLAVFHRLDGPPEALQPPRRDRGSGVGTSACG